MSSRGYVSILPVILALILIILGAGSFIYLNPKMPTKAPAPGEVSIDKTRPASGTLLVTFKSGTSYDTIETTLGKYEIEEYENIAWKSEGFVPQNTTIISSTDIFRVKVMDGQEQQMAELLKSENIIETVSLDYNN